MYIKQCRIQHFRNITQADLEFSAPINVFYGANGSGKTSLLESIYYLAFARSFRSHINNRLIQQNQISFSLFAATDENHLGLERGKDALRLRLNGNDIKSIAELANVFPLQIVHPYTHYLLEKGPEYRRQFIDWGVFHVEHEFIHAWRRYHRALTQRNCMLKQTSKASDIHIWHQELVNHGEKVSELRLNYLNSYLPLLQKTCLDLGIGHEELKIEYYPGWNQEKTLSQALSDQLHSDKQLGFTQSGPHRADLKIYLRKTPAKDVLSRGQQKIFVSAMQLAQGLSLEQETKKRSVYLIDDLPAELDEEKKFLLCKWLSSNASQAFITAIEKASLSSYLPKETAMFHVEHGLIHP